jgi:LysM repeat protein
MKLFMKYILISMLLSIVTLGTSTAQNASTDSVHTVQRGQTLFSIAQMYNISVDQLKEWNDLSGNALEVGQRLRVSDSQQNADITRHTVQKGETLYGISKQYQVSISALKKWNDLQNTGLRVGQLLLIHNTNQLTLDAGNEDADRAADTSSTLISTQPNEIPTTYYTVKSGDNLYNIARDYSMSVDQLKQLNDLRSSTIRVGQRLTVRKPRENVQVVESEESAASVQGNFKVITLKESQTAAEIYPNFQMDSVEFAQLNPDLSWNTRLIKGDQVTVLLPARKTNQNPYRKSSQLNDLGSTRVISYSNEDSGMPTTSGELYNPNELTAAHASIALGTVIYVEEPQSNQGTYLLVNDRISDAGLKLSGKAYQLLGFDEQSSKSASVTIYKNVN